MFRKVILFILAVIPAMSTFANAPDEFPRHLREKLAATKHSHDPQVQKKRTLFRFALENYHLNPTYTTHRLSNETDFTLSHQITPRYFGQTFVPSSIHTTSTGDFYDYKPAPTGVSDFWVDFSNRYFGGGYFSHGFVQEEIMLAEMPELANVAASITLPSGRSGVLTRTLRDQSDRVKEGSPKPIAFKGIHRVQAIEGVYGNEINTISPQALKHHVKRIQPAQTINILAIAAPKLRNTSEQAHLDTIEDLFNTCMAGFTLAKNSTNPKKRTRIHTGPFGCGAFHNSSCVVYVVQKLAAMQLGIDLVFHGYPRDAEEDLQAVLTSCRGDGSIQHLLQETSRVMSQRLSR